MDGDPGKLSQRAVAFLRDPANKLSLSVVSIWEIAFKQQLGKLRLNQPLHELVEAAASKRRPNPSSNAGARVRCGRPTEYSQGSIRPHACCPG
jgi:PIN domain nuclease of toxin-antitoxin system